MDALAKMAKVSPMQKTLVLTVLGRDRTGIVDSLAQVVSAQGGNWLESHLARFAGQFAGIVRITCPTEATEALTQELEALSGSGLQVTIAQDESEEDESATLRYHLDVLGNDRPGILSEVSRALRSQNANIIEINTQIEPAPETGQDIFHTIAEVTLPESSEPETLSEALEALSPDLQVALSSQ